MRNLYDKLIIDSFPVITKEYETTYGFRSLMGDTVKEGKFLYINIEQFKSIFDGSAFGQYLAERDQESTSSKLDNESCVFQPSKIKFNWKVDQQGRKVPYAAVAGKAYRINNLHVTGKKLYDLLSVDPRGLPFGNCESWNLENVGK